MKPNPIASIRTFAVCALLTLGSSIPGYAEEEKKVDPTGTWSWATRGRDGEEGKVTLILKAADDKLTGKMSAPTRGGQARDTEISKGMVKGDEISFQVTRERGSLSIVSTYSAKITGDTLKGKIETQLGQNTRTRDWEAKREAKKE